MPGLLEAMDAAISSVEKEDIIPSKPPPAPPPKEDPLWEEAGKLPGGEVELRPVDYNEVQQWLLQQPVDEDALALMREEEVRETSCGCMGRRRSATDVPGLDRSLWRDKDFVLSLRATKYSPGEDIHARMLRTVYCGLTRSPSCPDVGPHWDAIGFQHVDPCTDLNRCGGLLNVIQFFYFFSHHLEAAQAAAELARDPRQNFPLACISINITDIVIRSLLAGRLSKVCNSARHGVLETTCRLHAGAMCHFATRWRSMGRTIRDTEAALNEVRQLATRSPARMLEGSLQASR